ncbi:hypothetical protein [Halanaerobacter jeridensis]|uniref:Uncharacterized protein n=1 Tax=Halanaerobacter jeridensis TaxID=706427 RepID=A0A938XQP2_9FIRM|nr:hypothetical protein [Halanaerobacter jeridensis]MBM7558148.1 hypothetical protein [Halanaerobacter jeridensis]
MDYLIDRKNNALNLLGYKYKFKRIADWDKVLDKLNTESDEEKLARILWFMSVNSEEIPERVLEKIIKYINNDYITEIRGTAFEIFYKNRYKPVVKKMINNSWCWDSSNGLKENHWGSLLLCEYAEKISYSNLRDIIDPAYLGYAVKCRGENEEDIKQYIEDINLFIDKFVDNNEDLLKLTSKIEVKCNSDKEVKAIDFYRSKRSSNGVKFIDRNFSWGGGSKSSEKDLEKLLSPEKKEEEKEKNIQLIKNIVNKQKKAGNTWFVKRLDSDVIGLILKEDEIIDRLIEPVLDEKPDAIKKVIFNKGLYETICKKMIEITPEKGIKLYRKLNEIDDIVCFTDKNTHIPLLDYAVFNVSDNEVIEKEWNNYLKRCKVDQDLLELSILAETGQACDWLWNKIDEEINSEILFKQTRAMTILGFLNSEEAGEILQEHYKEEPKTWLDKVANESLKRFNKNIYAKYWFNEFLNEENEVKAWRSFRLFLQGVDRRFWVWVKDIKINKDNNYIKYNFFKDNLDTIKNQIRKNEKEFRKKFLGHKILEKQAWPWM